MEGVEESERVLLLAWGLTRGLSVKKRKLSSVFMRGEMGPER